VIVKSTRSPALIVVDVSALVQEFDAPLMVQLPIDAPSFLETVISQDLLAPGAIVTKAYM
jgi:hypothetical protein